MNEVLLKLAVGQIPHQVMNKKRLDEIVDLTVYGTETDIMNGLDSYIAGTIGPLIVALHSNDETQLPKTLARIEAVAKLVLSMKPGAR